MIWFGLFGFLTSSSTTRLFRGRVSRLTPDNFTCCHTETERGDHDFCLSPSHYTETAPTSCPLYCRYKTYSIFMYLDLNTRKHLPKGIYKAIWGWLVGLIKTYLIVCHVSLISACIVWCLVPLPDSET